MGQNREAPHGTRAAPPARRLVGYVGWFVGRLGLLVSVLGVVSLSTGVQVASAAHLTSVSPTSGCPDTTITFKGTGLTGKTAAPEWKDPAGSLYTTATTTATVISSTTATAPAPLFLSLEPSTGTVAIEESNTVIFTFPSLPSCYGKGTLLRCPRKTGISERELLLAIASIKDPSHERDYDKDHPAGFRTEQASGEPWRARPAGFEKVTDGVLTGILP